jgi:uncharacterized protein (UPF0335 family)
MAKRKTQSDPQIGHNSQDAANAPLKAFIERIERLEEEKQTVLTDIREVYAEAKGTGFDVKAMRTIVRMRKQDTAERAEQEAILDTYLHALGMLADTPLGKAAMEKATENLLAEG